MELLKGIKDSKLLELVRDDGQYWVQPVYTMISRNTLGPSLHQAESWLEAELKIAEKKRNWVYRFTTVS